MRAEKSAVMCTKTLLIAFNLFFVLVGLIVIAISCWALVSPNAIFGIGNMKIMQFFAWLLLTLGGILVFLAFLGCTGAALENRCLLIMFFTLLCGIFMGCLVAGVLIAVFREELATLAVNRLSVGVQQDYGISETWTEWIDVLQTKLQCCAVDNHGASLYTRSAWYFQKHNQRNNLPAQYTASHSPTDVSWLDEIEPVRLANVPPSCCLRDGDGLNYVNLTACQIGQPDSVGNPFLNPQGCAPAIAVVLRTHSVPILVALIASIIILVSGLILSLILLRGTVPDEYNTVVQTERR